MMKVVECMEDDSMHRKVGIVQTLQPTKVSVESTVQTMNGFKGGQKRKQEKKPPKNNLGHTQKKTILLKSNVSTIMNWDIMPRLQKGKA